MRTRSLSAAHRSKRSSVGQPSRSLPSLSRTLRERAATKDNESFLLLNIIILDPLKNNPLGEWLSIGQIRQSYFHFFQTRSRLEYLPVFVGCHGAGQYSSLPSVQHSVQQRAKNNHSCPTELSKVLTNSLAKYRTSFYNLIILATAVQNHEWHSVTARDFRVSLPG